MRCLHRLCLDKIEPHRERNSFTARGWFVSSGMLAMLASACSLDAHTPVRAEDDAALSDVRTTDATGRSDASQSDAPRPDVGTTADGGTTSDGASTPDAASDRSNPPSGTDGGTADVSLPDAPIDTAPPSDRSTPSDTSTPPPDVNTPPMGDGSVVDVLAPPSDSGPTCTAPEISCGGQCVSSTAPATCGSCTHDCTNLPHVSGAVTCQAGACVVPPSSCAPGWSHCSSNPDDGCEIDITKPEHCGSCSTVCMGATPLCAQNSADAGASGFQCKSQCSAPSPDTCGQSCVNKSTDPLNCGACGMSCPAPTSHGQASCSSSMCGFQCNTNYSACGNNCVDFNSDPQNCQTCGHVCVAPTNGTVTGCSAGQCQTACNSGYEKVGTNCVQLRYYIATNGNDSATGTETAPFRTWKRAATAAAAVSGPTIYFKAGTYASNTAGEDFATKIPEGATVTTLGGNVVLQGNSVAGFGFTGSGTVNGVGSVANLTLQGFSQPFSTTAGTQTLSNVTLTEVQTPMAIEGTSMTITNFNIESIAAIDQARVRYGTLTLSSGTTQSIGTSCLVTTPGNITAEAQGHVIGTNVTFYGLTVGAGARATVTGGTLDRSCPGNVLPIWSLAGATITLSNTHVTGPINFTESTVKMRGTTVDGRLLILNPGAYDFGSAAELGNNTFNLALAVSGANVTVKAAGNHWIPNEPPAGASGEIAAGTTISGVYSSANLDIEVASSSVAF